MDSKHAECRFFGVNELAPFKHWVAASLVALGLALLSAVPALAGTDVWTTNGPYGDSIVALAINPQNPSTLYAGMNSGGVYESTDGGASWNSINNGDGLSSSVVWSLAINPQTPSTLYAGTGGGGVYESTDGGASWSAINSGLTDLSVGSLAINPQTPSTLYAGTGSGVYESTDGGASWNAINNGLANSNVGSLAINPQTPSTLYAATGSGVYESTDGGASWNAINNGLASSNVGSLAINPQSPSTLYAGTGDVGVYESTDGGASWNAINNGLTYWDVSSLAINPQSPSTLYAGTWGGGVYESTDGGASWNAINNGLTDLWVGTLAINPQSPSTLYAGTGSGDVFSLTKTTPPSGYSVSGTITLNGVGLASVTLTAGSVTATSDISGNYTLNGFANGAYTVTPNLSGYTFSPATQIVTVNGANLTGVDFTAASASACALSCTASAPANGQTNTPISFQATATVSAGCNGATPSYVWDFGDGGTSTQQNPTHIFSTPGTYNWTVTVTAAGAATCSRTQSIVISSGGGTTIMDEFNGSTLGDATGITYAPALSGEGAVFDRIDSSRIEYSFNSGIPHEGTLEWWVNIASGYFYTNYQLYDHQDSAFLFGTDCNGGDVNYPGGAKLIVNADGSILFQMGNEYGQADYHNLSAASSPFGFNSWHSIGVSFGSQGNYLMVDGVLVASDPSYTQSLQSAGNFSSPVDVPTIGDAQSGFWAPDQYDGGFYGIVDRFRASTNQEDWVLSAAPPTSTCALTCTASVPAEAQAGSGISFQASSVRSAGCSGATVSYLWNFGDGGNSTEQNPTHTYTAANTYDWSVTASMPGASPCVQTGTITISGSTGYSISGQVTCGGGGLPGVTISVTVTHPNPPQPPTLIAQTVTDANGGFSVSVPAAGSYQLAPCFSGYYFSPACQVVTLDQWGASGITFTAFQLNYLPVPFLSQRDPRWACYQLGTCSDSPCSKAPTCSQACPNTYFDTIYQEGCYITSIAMVMDFINPGCPERTNPYHIDNTLWSNGSYQSCLVSWPVTINNITFNYQAGTAKGVPLKDLATLSSAIDQQLSLGLPVLAAVRYKKNGTYLRKDNTHMVVIIGKAMGNTSLSSYYILDPWDLQQPSSPRTLNNGAINGKPYDLRAICTVSIR